MDFSKIKVGVGLTGSFCTLNEAIGVMEKLVLLGMDVYPIISYSVKNFDTRFGKCKDFADKIESLTGKNIISTIVDAEPIGPKGYLDIMVVCPCTGNTLAKLANGITDTPVTMASKAHLRNQKPLVLSIATNDALGMNAKNIGVLNNAKNVYFVPYFQDDPYKKTNSLIANTELLLPTIESALRGEQIQPIFTK
jgi:dipicolinate synthase subunit B